MKIQKQQAGLTLIELMIALILGLLVSGAVITIFISNVKSTTENIKMIHLNQELRSAMNFISDEIKRAGYSANSDEGYMAAWDTSTANCVIYAYDQNADGSAYVATADRLGFRLSGTNEIEWGQPVTSCVAGTWQPLTESEVANITTFTITPSAIAAGSLNIHQIVVNIVGETTLNPDTATRTITEIIRVRNEDDT